MRLCALAGIVPVVMSLQACGVGGTPSQPWADVLGRAGFTNVTQTEARSKVELYQVTAGNCQVRVVVNLQEQRSYATVPGTGLSADKAEFVGDPSLELLKRDPRFAHCFNPAPSAQPKG